MKSRSERSFETDRSLASVPAPVKRSAEGAPARLPDAATLAVAGLFADPALDSMMRAVQEFSGSIGAQFDYRTVPTELARGGRVGRIGVPLDAIAIMLEQRVLLGASFGADVLSPTARLWRGLQRRADVLVDILQCTTLPHSAAAASGNERDVLLFSQRIVDRTPRRQIAIEDASADQWARARYAAELAYGLAVAEDRQVLMVTGVGRSTSVQQLFADAMERQARLHRLPAPRLVKAGLLSALLSGATGSGRLMVASVMPIDELSAMVCEAIGDTGPWPVFSVGRDANFYDMPASAVAGRDPVPLLLVVSSLLHRTGRADLARTLRHAVLMTAGAESRMREELNGQLVVPIAAFLHGVIANWGRTPIAAPKSTVRSLIGGSTPVVVGLRLRIETSLTSAAVRQAVSRALLPAGLEVASVRSADGRIERGVSAFDVRVRTVLGEPPLSDRAAKALVHALGDQLRCVGVEPWSPMSTADRPPRLASRRVS